MGWGNYAWDLLADSRLEGARVEPADVGAVLAEATGTRDFSPSTPPPAFAAYGR